MRPVGRTAKFSKIMLEVAYGRDLNIKFSGNSNCKLPQLETSVALCLSGFLLSLIQGAPV